MLVSISTSFISCLQRLARSVCLSKFYQSRTHYLQSKRLRNTKAKSINSFYSIGKNFWSQLNFCDFHLASEGRLLETDKLLPTEECADPFSQCDVL